METIRPASVADLAAAIASAQAAGRTLALLGSGSKRGYGRPEGADATLDLSAFSGIVDYQPSELVLTARAATPMAEIADAIGAARQILAFEPPDLGRLYGARPGGGTLGGALAANLAGPRRVKSGAARDHFLGFSGVSGRGEIFKGGGKVVKNVTGYDLPKLMAGSLGTLAALDTVTIKVMPAPAEVLTILIGCNDAHEAVRHLAWALNSPCEVSGAAYLPGDVACHSSIHHVRGCGTGVAAIRLEGTANSVAARARALATAPELWRTEMPSDLSRTFWSEIRDVADILPYPASAIWRVSVPPSAGPDVVAAAVAAAAEPRDVAAFYDWGGGLVWLATAADGDAGAVAIRAAVAQAGGHATLVRAPDAVRAVVSVFEPLAGPLAGLAARVKAAFDPARILNRGRVFAEAAP